MPQETSRHSHLLRRLRFVPLTLALCAGALASGAAIAQPAAAAAATPQFSVAGNTLRDPEGRALKIKGATIAYGTFAGGDEANTGQRNFDSVETDLPRLAQMGVNLVRVFVTTRSWDDAHLSRLDHVVSVARRAGFVVEVSNSYSGFDDSLRWVGFLAGRYKDDPGVWLSPQNEPNCPASECGDWTLWASQTRRYVGAIRDAGMGSPIVVDGTWWSWDLTRIDDFPLGDANVIYGAHRYANNNDTFNATERDSADRQWGAAAAQHAILVEEVGAFNGPEMRNSPEWMRGFLDYVADWVNNRGGVGAVAFNWHWVDANTMTQDDGTLTQWGHDFLDHYLNRVGVTGAGAGAGTGAGAAASTGTGTGTGTGYGGGAGSSSSNGSQRAPQTGLGATTPLAAMSSARPAGKVRVKRSCASRRRPARTRRAKSVACRGKAPRRRPPSRASGSAGLGGKHRHTAATKAPTRPPAHRP